MREPRTMMSPAQISRFAEAIQWILRNAWRTSSVQVSALVLASIVSRLSQMSGFILALLAINFVVSREHRAQLLAKHGLSETPDLVFVVAITSVVAGIFLFSVTANFWKKQTEANLTDKIAKKVQKDLFEHFSREVRSTRSQPARFSSLYETYTNGLERRLTVSLKLATGHAIDAVSNSLSLAATMAILSLVDVLPLIIVISTLAIVSIAYVVSSRRQKLAIDRFRQKASLRAQERREQMRNMPADIDQPDFWSKISASHTEQFSDQLRILGNSHQYYSEDRGWSFGRIFSNPAILTPITAAIVFSTMILYFYFRSHSDSITLHGAIIIVFIVRFALMFGNGIAMDIRKFSERHSDVVLLRQIRSGRATIVGNLKVAERNSDTSRADPIAED